MTGSAARRLERFIPPGVVLAVTAAMIAWIWKRTPDPVVDFGREVYVPWRITEGQVLFRDLHYFNGPFSPYFNALAFRLFGVSLTTIKIVNATIIIMLALLLYRMIKRMSGWLAAMVGGVVFACVFACGQLTVDPNFDFLTPYSHDLTHGVALSMLMLAALANATGRRQRLWIALAGLLFGLITLTKAEVVLAAFVGAAVGLTAILWTSKLPPRRWLRPVVIFVAAAIVPPLMALLLLMLAMPLSEALAGVSGTWRWAGDPRLLQISYFRWTLGIDEPELNIKLMLRWTAGIAALPISAAVITLLLRSWRPRLAGLAALVLGTGSLALLALLWGQIRWRHEGRPLPLFLLVIAISLLIQIRHRSASTQLVLPLAWTCFALALLAKIFLRTVFFHYGFALAMPGAMIVIAALLDWVPKKVAAGDERLAWVARAPLLGAVAVFLGVMFVGNERSLSFRKYPVGSGADAFFANERAVVVDEAVRRIRALTRPDETLTVVPEGIMLNYLSRRVNPTRWQNFLPAEVMLFDEQKMLADLNQHPPDWIALVHTDTRIYDAQFFGRDYGHEIGRWIFDNYHPVDLAGEALPFTSDKFGILIVRRNSAR